MRIDILTLFPQMCQQVMAESIIGRAWKKGIIDVACHNIRDYTENKQKQVDDMPFGGGMGVVMQAQPIYDCYMTVKDMHPAPPHAIYLSPQGKPLTQAKAVELSKLPRLVLICGHYEGVDERVLEELQVEEISIGDYVLTGGELPALVLADCVCRMVPGVLSAEECFTEESHYAGLLEYPQYSRPREWKGREVPEVLLSGHHKNIEVWRRQQSLLRTKSKRPDLFEKVELTKQDKAFLVQIEPEECLGDSTEIQK
ncbi:MAG: tRNA (guanosine(37)-N1)-methyltransferase TrmD [Clostridia bacterium]|nr:tRNA (guanosine(37)-N1)-methyltransferase TrmD [Clostridia bacterium]